MPFLRTLAVDQVWGTSLDHRRQDERAGRVGVCTSMPLALRRFKEPPPHTFVYSFSALTLLVGRQEGHLACKN